MRKYFGYFGSYENFINLWEGASIVPEDKVLIAAYDAQQYDGSAFCLFEGADGKLYEVYCSHCSCNGLDRFAPEESNLKALQTFRFSEMDEEFHTRLTEIIKERS